MLEIEGPQAMCSYCRFTAALRGRFSAEDGLLVWRAAPDPQPGRGPDLESCCEESGCGDFDRITADGEDLTSEEITALRAAAAGASAAEMASWAAQPR